MKAFRRFIITTILVGAVAVVPIAAAAQPMMIPGTAYEEMGPPVGPGMMMHCMGPGMMGPGMMRGMGPGSWGPLSGIDLTDEQNAKIAPIEEEFSFKHWELMHQLHDEQFKLQQLYSTPTPDNAVIDAQFAKIRQLRRQMWQDMTDARKKTEAVLTNEQRSAIRRRGRGHMMWGW